MGLGVDPVCRLLVWRIDETECCSPLRIVPIGNEFHAVLILDFQVLYVSWGMSRLMLKS